MRALRWTFHTLKYLALPLVLVVLFLVLRHIGFSRILADMRRMHWSLVLICAALHAVGFALWCLRWQQLMPADERRSMLTLMPIYMAGVFGNVVTPGARVGGEPIRAYYVSRACGRPVTVCLGTVLADKMTNAAVFIVFLLLSVTLVALLVGISLTSRLGILGMVLLAVAVLIALVLLRTEVKRGVLSLRRLLPPLYRWRPMAFLRKRFATCEEFEAYVAEHTRNVFAPIARTAGSAKTLAHVSALSAGAWLLFCFAHYVLFRGLGVDIGFLRVVIIVTISTFFGDTSIVPGGAGVQETAMIAICAAYGLEPGASAAVTLVSRVLFYIYGLGVGGLCLIALSLRYGRADKNAAEQGTPGGV